MFRCLRAVPAALTAYVLLLAGCSLSSDGGVVAPVVVGVFLQPAGESSLDQVYLNGLELRTEQLNVQRARAGEALLELRYGDSIADLVADPRVVAVIAGSCGDCVVEAVEEVEAAGVPLVTLAPGAELVTPPQERRHVFQLAPDPAQAADLIAQHVSVSGGGGDVAVVASADRYGRDGAEELAAALPAFDLQLAYVERVEAGLEEEAAAAVAAEIVGWSPPPADPFALPEPGGVDTVVVWTQPEEALRVVRALRRTGFDGGLVLESRAADQPFLGRQDAQVMAGAQMLASPALTVDQMITTNPAVVNRSQWVSRYISTHFTNHVHAAYAADALDLIHTAVSRVGVERSAVRDLLENVYQPGLAGDLRFAPSNHNGLDTASFVIVQFTGDRWSFFLN